MDADTIVSLVTGVTKKWCKQRKAEERQKSRICNRRYAMTRSSRVTIKDVAWAIMPQAYAKVSANGQYPAHARQIMYAARPDILARADCETLNDAYFTQQLLPDFMQEHPDLTAKWEVVFDARGHLTEPHTERQVALGTLDVRSYLAKIREHVVEEISADVGSDRFPTMGPRNRYGAILFIEKEGFDPLFKKVQLYRRYDVAPMSTKGLSSTAARLLVDTLCQQDVPLLVLHDFDKAGFSILGTLQRDTRRYTFSHKVNVIDLGLRLQDVQDWKLQAEQCSFGKSDPKCNLRENGAPDEEIRFLCGGYGYRGYKGQRVELNAFTSGDLVQWIEGKLQQHGIKKIIPDKETLQAAYRRAAVAHIANSQLESIIKTAQERVDAEKLKPAQIIRDIKKQLKKCPSMSWDQAIIDIIEASDTE
jgi:hypothetical protein